MPGLHVLELFDLTVGLLVPISYCAPWCKLLFHLMPFQSAEDLNTSNLITNASDVCVISAMAEHTPVICSYVIFSSAYAIFSWHKTNSPCLQVLLCSIGEVIIF